jgi:hypothetical protein
LSFFLAVNVFKGVLNNPLFCSILVITAMLQVIIVEFGQVAFSVVKGGLDPEFWLLSIVLGAVSLPVQQIINVLYNISVQKKGSRSKRRLKREGQLSTRQANGGGHHAHRE